MNIKGQVEAHGTYNELSHSHLASFNAGDSNEADFDDLETDKDKEKEVMGDKKVDLSSEQLKNQDVFYFIILKIINQIFCLIYWQRFHYL